PRRSSDLEIASVHEVVDMVTVPVRTGDPARAVGDAGIDEVAQARGALESEERVREGLPGADVARDQLGQPREVRVRRRFHGDLALAQAAGPLRTVQVDLAVAGESDDDDLAFAARVGHGDDDVLQGVRGRPRAVL